MMTVLIGDKIGELLIDANSGEGEVVLSPSFMELNGTLQLDVLANWTDLLEGLWTEIYELEYPDLHPECGASDVS